MIRLISSLPVIAVLGFCLVSIGALAAPAAEDAPAAYALPHSQILPVTSQTNGVDYQLYVKLPAGYEDSDKSYPLLVTLDADYQFVIAANHVEHLAQRGQAPEMIVVSIGYAYDPADKRAYRINRTRDYTPVHTPEGGYGPEIQKFSGGGPAFATFIQDEVLPLLEKTYRIDQKERTYIGHSYGGMFGAYLLLSHPDIFNRYILVSPSLWFNDKMFLDEETMANAAPLQRKTYVYMGVGDWENQTGNGRHAMADDLKTFAALLEARKDPNLVFKYRVFEDETHASIYPAVLSTGIRHLFQTMQ